ncbi:MAG: FapA family protein [Clostridiales bacterium]|nr:MAG: FapA family protein [Clostridiales bacterium]
MKLKKSVNNSFDACNDVYVTAERFFSVYADVETADITSNEDWNDGETKGNVTISGNVTITVNGVVNIDGPITINGNVTINNGTNGAGTLKRTSNTGNILIVENGAKLTLNSVVIDGDNIVVSDRDGEERRCSAIYVKGGEVESNAASLVKHKKTGEIYRGGVRGAAVYMAGGKFTMNGGTIADCEARSYGGAVFLDEYAEFIMNGGTVESNKTLDQTASFGGGAFYVREGTLKINYGTIRNNSSTKRRCDLQFVVRQKP